MHWLLTDINGLVGTEYIVRVHCTYIYILFFKSEDVHMHRCIEEALVFRVIVNGFGDCYVHRLGVGMCERFPYISEVVVVHV